MFQGSIHLKKPVPKYSGHPDLSSLIVSKSRIRIRAFAFLLRERCTTIITISKTTMIIIINQWVVGSSWAPTRAAPLSREKPPAKTDDSTEGTEKIECKNDTSRGSLPSLRFLSPGLPTNTPARLALPKSGFRRCLSQALILIGIGADSKASSFVYTTDDGARTGCVAHASRSGSSHKRTSIDGGTGNSSSSSLVVMMIICHAGPRMENPGGNHRVDTRGVGENGNVSSV